MQQNAPEETYQTLAVDVCRQKHSRGTRHRARVDPQLVDVHLGVDDTGIDRRVQFSRHARVIRRIHLRGGKRGVVEL